MRCGDTAAKATRVRATALPNSLSKSPSVKGRLKRYHPGRFWSLLKLVVVLDCEDKVYAGMLDHCKLEFGGRFAN